MIGVSIVQDLTVMPLMLLVCQLGAMIQEDINGEMCLLASACVAGCIGAVAGAVWGGICSATSGGSFWEGALSGGLSGFVSGFASTFGPIWGAIGGAFASVSAYIYTSDNPTNLGVAAAALTGAIGGAVGGIWGGKISNFVDAMVAIWSNAVWSGPVPSTASLLATTLIDQHNEKNHSNISLSKNAGRSEYKAQSSSRAMNRRRVQPRTEAKNMYRTYAMRYRLGRGGYRR